MVWIQAENQSGVYWKINLCGAALNIALNALLIPIWGINGAAIASFFSQVFTNYLICHIIVSLRAGVHLLHQALNPKYLLGEIKRLFGR